MSRRKKQKGALSIETVVDNLDLVASCYKDTRVRETQNFFSTKYMCVVFVRVWGKKKSKSVHKSSLRLNIEIRQKIQLELHVEMKNEL